MPKQSDRLSDRIEIALNVLDEIEREIEEFSRCEGSTLESAIGAHLAGALKLARRRP
jgi:hypothetical protein